jgi:hypothetical protein
VHVTGLFAVLTRGCEPPVPTVHTGDSRYNETRYKEFHAIPSVPTGTDDAPWKHFISIQRISRHSDFILGMLALTNNESHLDIVSE